MPENTTPQGATATVKEPKRGQQKIGQVVSTKMQKTIVVEVSRRVAHPLYRRIVKKRKKFYAHDEQEQAKVGDLVKIIEHRPLSKLKRWALAEIVRAAVQVGAAKSQLVTEKT
jgi:small subunit ribosomal protein S17